MVTYLPGLHVLVRRIAGTRCFSDERHVNITPPDMGKQSFMLDNICKAVTFEFPSARGNYFELLNVHQFKPIM